MNKPIGGFYEFLLPEKSFDYHGDSIYLTNGRACIRTIIKHENIKRCYVPNYTCDAVYHPFVLEKIDITLYHIDSYLAPVELPELQEGEYFYYINYYGVKSDIVIDLINKYGNKLIIDNTHSFFKKKIPGCWSFTSARKYFGVPDGAFLYAPKTVNNTFERFEDYSISHNIERLKGNQEEGFKYYTDYEKSLNSEIKRISVFSEKLLSLVNINKVMEQRKVNFNYLHDKLNDGNELKFALLDDDVPFCYPFLPKSDVDKKIFYKQNIFIPTLWKDPLDRFESNDFEVKMAQNLLPVPIDERYSAEDMNRIVDIIQSL